jgi:outer membrane protein assembly factor BamB
MTWNIVASVTIDGVAYTNDAIGALSVNFGRNNVWDQQRASVATVRLIDIANTGFPIDINDPVVIRIQNATNTADITIFTTSKKWTFDASNNQIGTTNSPVYKNELSGYVFGIVNNGKFALKEIEA